MPRVATRFVARLAALAVLLSALLVGCLSIVNEQDLPGADPYAAPRPGVDRYALREGSTTSVSGCRFDYRVFEPIAAAGATTGASMGTEGSKAVRPRSTVLVGHGFLRDQDTMVGLARALADAGHRVVTLDFCNMRPWNGHHVRNAADMRALAREFGPPGRTIYAGFSAGALAAVIAGAGASAAGDVPLGVMTLDLVDQGDLGVTAARGLDAPLRGLAGPPSGCNANGNGERVFAVARDARLETVAGASHCEFESPTTGLCERFCGDEGEPAGADAAERLDIIRSTVADVDALSARDEFEPSPAVRPGSVASADERMESSRDRPDGSGPPGR